MGHVKRRSGNWQASYRAPGGRERTKTFERKKDAEDWVAEQEFRARTGAWIEPARGRVRFADWVDEYLSQADYKRPTTLARDQQVIRTHLLPAFGGQALATITPAEIRLFVKSLERGRKPKTVQTIYGVLHAILNAAVDADIIARSPCRGVKLPTVRRGSGRIASTADVHRLAAAVPDEYRAAIYLGVMGLREAEVFGLRARSIDLRRKTVTVDHTINEVEGHLVEGEGKTETSVRTIAIPPFLADLLGAFLRERGRSGEDLVFQAPRGGPVRANNFRGRVYNPAIKALGLDGLTFHRLRHSAGHIMRESGTPIEVIQKRLGHRSIRTTADVYGTLPESVDRRVADELGRMLEADADEDEDEDDPPAG